MTRRDDRRGAGPPRRRPRDRYGRPLPAGIADQLRSTVAPGAPALAPRELFRRGTALFDQARFFEAHEMFEELWKSERTPAADRPFWRAVTQVAVGYCHAQRGNAAGARALLERAVAGLAAYPSPHRGVETRALIDAARRRAAEIAAPGARAELDFPRFPKAD